MTYHGGNQLVNIHRTLETAHVLPGMHVADLGCGRTGNVVFPLAQVVGEHGMVYAVDIMKDVLAEIDKRARLENFHNVFTVWADLEHPGGLTIPEGTLDIGFFVNTLFHFPNIEACLDEAYRTLAAKSRLVVVDWIKSDLPFGPNDDQLIDFGRVEAWARSKGFAVQEHFQPGDHHAGVVFYKHDEINN